MSIFREMAGYTYGHADVVRRAMSKKKADVLNAERESFLLGTQERGVDIEVAGKLFDDISSFANYAFNKSHAAAYAVISYRTAYLKAHYPCEYMAALMTSVLGNLTKLAEYIGECSKLGISVLPPDINRSRTFFHPHGKNIVFGLLALKNVGKQFVDNIIREREHGDFSDFEDFVQRMSEYDINKRMVEGLIKAGCFDNLGTYRSRLLASYERLIDIRAEKNRSNISGQLDMFSSAFSGVSEHTPKFEYPNVPDFSLRDKLMLEKESSGMYFSGHMIDNYSNHVLALDARSISEILDGELVKEKQSVRICGMITSISVKTTRKNERMAFITLEDRYGEIECLVFPNKYSEYSHILRLDSPLYISGTVSLREDEDPKILVNTAEELIDNAHYKQKPKVSADTKTEKKPESGKPSQISKLYLRVDDLECAQYKKAANLVDIFDGTVKVIFFSKETQKYYDYPVGVSATEYILEELQAILGKENVVAR